MVHNGTLIVALADPFDNRYLRQLSPFPPPTSGKGVGHLFRTVALTTSSTRLTSAQKAAIMAGLRLHAVSHGRPPGRGRGKDEEPPMSEHAELQQWIRDMAELCRPDEVIWIDGGDAQKDALTAEAFKTGELIELDRKKLPGCMLHRTAIDDVARTEHLTYVCTRKKEDAGPTNNWMDPQKAYEETGRTLAGSMAGRSMYVIPFSLGPIGSPFSKIGVELTDSIYVVLNMLIMCRCGTRVLKQLGSQGTFTRCVHSRADMDVAKRRIMHFPEDNTIWSVCSGYGGNVLLGKKCLALRIASHVARHEGWLAEHMLILGIEPPDGRVEYVAAAFPSACGKTNLAMLVPPEGLKQKGYRIWTVGDDIAWMRIDTDGALWAVNPENGFFGVAPGTNWKTNPNAMQMIRKNTIYTNVLLKPDKTVWWEDGDGPPPESGIDWTGKPWKPTITDEHGKPMPGANPNSRYTAPLTQCPTVSHRVEHHHGVKISAILFGGRRAKLAPLVHQAHSWQHGVFLGATMASERTAAQYGKFGEVRRDPMAMLPFCGYNMADYFRHWLEMGARMTDPPKIFHVNWFRTDADGDFLWPGFGENLRVLEWILQRCRGEGRPIDTPIGLIPSADAMDLTGLELSPRTMNELLRVDRTAWQAECDQIEAFFQQFGDRLPHALADEAAALRRRLENA
jgi:phosphoenolpyruvate carboxykinase (GTP)